MTRQTSIDIYREIEASGLLTKLRWQVYACLFKFGPLSQNETSYKLRGKLSWGINPRFSELEKMGVIISVGERSDRHTGNNVLVWDTTNNLPKKLIKEPKEICLMCNQEIRKRRNK